MDFKSINNPDAISEYMDYTLIEVEGESKVPRMNKHIPPDGST